jgi:hypothetical protein
MHQLLPQVSHRIPLDKAVKMTRLYRQQKDLVIKEEFKGKNILSVSETFNREAFDRLLAQKECVGVRIYYSMDETLKMHAIIVGVNEKNEDMLPKVPLSGEGQVLSSSPEAALTDESEVIEEGALCPPACAPSSPLNS